MREKYDECLKTLNSLFDIYQQNDYIIQRIYNHIVVNLPNTLKTESLNHQKRQNLNSYLTEEQHIFTQVFLNTHNYYYLSNIGLFYEYNGHDFLIIKEDDIIHKLLSTISKDKTLMQWKYKTKQTVIKLIKERNLFSCIPETDTIQSVLNHLYPYFFISKNHAKYFLTVIGDNILKKTNNSIYMVTPKMRHFLTELNNMTILSIGSEIGISKFITKYHENHLFENIRLLQINENFENEYWRELLKKLTLNLLCVAVHYSKRYQSAEDFLNTHIEDKFAQNVCNIKNTTPNQIITRFVDKYIDKTNIDYTIDWKNLYFIWKQYLSDENIPSVIFSQTLKDEFTKIFLYDKEKDLFVGVTSKFLPLYKNFIDFWNSTIIHNQPNLNDHFDDDIEVDELVDLYKHWSKSKHHLTEDTILKILTYYFPEVDIIDEKYILNITSREWNKKLHLEGMFEDIEKQLKEDCKTPLISFDTIYSTYQQQCKKKNIQFIVNKRYFEKYLCNYYKEFIQFEKFISRDSLIC